jgi:glycine dehydrogenase subunit 2
MKAINEEISTQPELVTEAPHTTPVSKLDEAKAAREPQLKWEPS